MRSGRGRVQLRCGSSAMISESQETPGSAPSSAQEAAYDARLVHQVQAGDDDAFAEIVARHKGRLFRRALGFTGNRCDAEDVVQDAFIGAYRAIGRFRGD